MRDFESLLPEVDRIPAPNLWPDIVQRESRMLRLRETPRARRLITALVALAIAVAGTTLAFLALRERTYVRPADEPTPTTKIAFVRNLGHDLEIFVMNADGTDQAQVTDAIRGDSLPSWSPDGKRIAFTSDRGQAVSGDASGNDDIYVMNADGTGLQQLTDSPGNDFQPIWSPDGSKIAFDSERAGDLEIYVMNADGTGQTRLTDRPGSDYVGSWSPDGTKIAFYSGDGSGEYYDVFVMNADGSGVRDVAGVPGANDILPSWSPDGSQIAFTSDRDGNNEIYILHTDGSGETRLTQDPADDEGAAWSPDSSQIAFTSDRDGNQQIYVMNADGTGIAKLTEGPLDSCCPTWQMSAQT